MVPSTGNYALNAWAFGGHLRSKTSQTPVGKHLDLEGLPFLIIISQNAVHNQVAVGVIGS